jgi:hypothetical protein
MADKLQNVSVTHIPRPQREGPLFSRELYAASEEAINRDLLNLSAGLNANNTVLQREITTRLQDLRAVRGLVDELDDREIADRISLAYTDYQFPPLSVGMFRRKGALHEFLYRPTVSSGFDEGKRLRLDTKYGQLTLPFKTSLNAVYGISTDGGIRLPDNLETTVVDVTSAGVTKITGNARFAVDGREDRYWVRKVAVPVHSTVTTVQMTFQVDLPNDAVSAVNLISADPFPLGQLDIVGMEYSSDTSDPSTTVPGFSEVADASHTRWHFVQTSMTKLKLTLEQRNWVEEEGHKVFYLGLRELRLQLASFPADSDTYGIVLKLDSPGSLLWDVVRRFDSGLTPASGTFRAQIYTDPELATLIWDSNTNLPQDTAGIQASKASILYLRLTLDRQSDGTSPVLEWLSLGHTLQDAADSVRQILKLTALSTAPASPSAGWVYYDSTLGRVRVYNGTAWVDLNN